MPDDSLSRLLASNPGDSGQGKEESVWNLFVQILLPLILVLTFLAVVDIVRYKISAEVTAEENDAIREELQAVLESDDENDLILKSHRSILDTQRQKLLLALSEVRVEERKKYKLWKFDSAADVQMDGATITDADFRILCNSIREDIVQRKSAYRNVIYRKVLEKSKLRDRHSPAVKRRDEVQTLYGEDEVLVANLDVVSQANRYFIHNRIVEFADTVHQETLELQMALVTLIFDELIANPSELKPSTREIFQQMLRPEIEEQQRGELAEQAYREITKEVRSDIREFGFLDESWQQLAALEGGKK